MALTSASYLGDGVNSLFSVTFNYLSRSNVKVFINGVEDTTFSWITSSSIQTTNPPPAGATVVVKRDTPTTPLVDFVDGSTITENLLDTSTVQSLHVAEETKEFITGQIQLDTTDNTFNAGNKRIKNVAAPVGSNDVATKNWTETALSSGVNQAQTAANQASASAVSANNSAVTATTQANNASTSASTASTQAGIATTRANEAAASASAASSSASTATIKAGEANTSANTASSQASVATNNANSASNSATTASTQASIATAQAVIATNKAAEAAASALVAQDIAGSYVRASEEEAELGEENSHYMTSLRTKQAIESLARGGISSIAVFNYSVSSQLWIVPDKVFKIKVTAVGAGGQAVGTSGSAGGGGAGGYSIKYADVVPGEEIVIYVGAAAGSTSGQVAGTTSVSGDNFFIQATGGTSSYSGSNAPGVGGIGSGGDINGKGAFGLPGGTGAGAGGSSILSAGGGGAGAASGSGTLGSGGGASSASRTAGNGVVLIEY